MQSSQITWSWYLLLITAVFKKNARTSKNDNRLARTRPLSVLLVISEIFERIICNQLPEFFEEIFSKFQCDFRKSYNTQYYLLMMLESWKEAGDKNKDCLSHGLLIAKLYAYRINRL